MTTQEDYRVELDAYSGPLDLLLYLVRRHEIDLNDIPIARLAEQYIAHLKLLQEVDVDLAGDFLVMAATLLEIKSQMIIPHDADDDAADGEQSEKFDPRLELVQQLLAYKRFKDAADVLDKRRETWEQRYPIRPSKAVKRDAVPGEEGNAAPIEIDLEDANIMDLCEAFSRILDSIGQTTDHHVTYDDTPIELHAADIEDRLQREGKLTLQQIFIGRSNRGEMIGLFLATLELVRQKKVRVLQGDVGGEIQLELNPLDQQLSAGDDKAADWRDPKTGEMQYEWPSDDARVRAERRAKLRASWAKKKQGDEAGAEAEDEQDVIDVDGDDVAAQEQPAAPRETREERLARFTQADIDSRAEDEDFTDDDA